MTLEARKLDFAYHSKDILSRLDLMIPEGRITALVGANGSGKSTILKNLARILRPSGGAVYLDGKALHGQPTKAIAREMAVLPQNPDAPGGLLVRELVGYGRFPWQSGFSAANREDHEKIAHALELTNMTDFADRPVGTLSGGQRQRAWIAMALAQDSRILLLDEPTTFLDMAHQFEVLSLIARLNREQGRTIVMVVHDLNHATRYAHHMIAIHDGEVIASGAPVEVLTPGVLQRVFGVVADLLVDPRTGTTLCVPYGLSADQAEP